MDISKEFTFNYGIPSVEYRGTVPKVTIVQPLDANGDGITGITGVLAALATACSLRGSRARTWPKTISSSSGLPGHPGFVKIAGKNPVR